MQFVPLLLRCCAADVLCCAVPCRPVVVPCRIVLCRAMLVPGRELLTTYEENNNGFFDAMTTNIRQHCYVQTLAAKSEVGNHLCISVLPLA